MRLFPLGTRIGRSAVAVLVCAGCLASLGEAQGQQRREKFRPVARDRSNQPPPPEGAARRLVFVGNKSFNEEQLREPLANTLRDIEQDGLTKPRADDAAYFLSVFYRKQGFIDADVRFDIRGSRLVLNIKEGPRAYLRRINFAGNKTQSTETLYEYMIGETGERLLRQPEKFPFVEADVQTGVARIRGLYESEGRQEAQISDPEFSYSRNRTEVDVTVRIVEGPKYEFGEVTFRGPMIFDRATLLKALGNPSGEEPRDKREEEEKNPLAEPYTLQRANTMQHNLLYFFKLKGYYSAEVQVAAEETSAGPVRQGVRKVPVVFTLKPGPLYRFDGIQVKGLSRLRPSFLEKRFGSLHGETYNPTVLDERYREVLRTGLFRNLRMTTRPLPSNEVEIALDVEEAKAKEVGFSIGFSSYEGAIIGTRLSDRNFLGNGRPLSLQLDYTTRGIRGELLYVDPWWFDSNFGLRARLFALQRTEIGFSRQEFGLRGDITRKLTKQIETGVFLSARNVEVTEAEIEQSFLGATSYQIATLGVTQTFDYRDSPVSPSRGWIIALGADVDTIAGEVAFGRATARLSYYIPIQKRFLLALGARAGTILPFSDIPISERFFLGGATTVRSFRERRLGPTDKNNLPVGGETFTVFNAEFIIPVKDALSVALFADAGNLMSQYQDAGLQELRYGVGVGLRYNLPIGPVRLDVGLNPAPKANESWGAVHFTFGFAF